MSRPPRPTDARPRRRIALAAALVALLAAASCTAALGRDNRDDAVGGAPGTSAVGTGAAPVPAAGTVPGTAGAPAGTVAPSTTTPRTPWRVIVVGDSLLFGAGWYVEQGIAARGGQTVFDHGIIGWTSGQLRPVAEQAIDTVPADILVFETGSNDVRDSLFYPDPAAALDMAGVERDAVLDHARAAGLCVVTVGVATRIDDRGLISFGPGWNTAARSAVTARDGVWVDWQAISADHPDWFVEDGLHHKAAGSAAFGDALAAAAARCAAGRPSVP